MGQPMGAARGPSIGDAAMLPRGDRLRSGIAPGRAGTTAIISVAQNETRQCISSTGSVRFRSRLARPITAADPFMMHRDWYVTSLKEPRSGRGL
jgi:hypothetical protein